MLLVCGGESSSAPRANTHRIAYVLAPGLALCTGATYLYRIRRKCSCSHATRANTNRPASVLAPIRACVRASIRSVRGGNAWHFRSPPPASQVRIYRHLCLTNAGICAIISYGKSGGRSFGKRCGIWSGNRRGGLVPYISGIPPSPIFMSSLGEILSHFTP